MIYIYDASGEHVIKSHGDGQAIYVNGFPMGGSGTVGNYTVYVNPFMVFQNFKYTKHFYIEGQRIVSKLGEMGVEQELLLPKSHAGDSLKTPVRWDSKKELSKDIIIANFEALGLSGAVFTAGKSGKIPYGQIKKYYRNADVIINSGTTTTSSKKTEDLQFYYHPDHLGSSSYITDVSGEVYQHMEYFPFGETFIEERNDAEYTNYLYNGKELDEETGLYYYGARYYDARTSVWYGVDPLTERYIYQSPFVYCRNNPIVTIDPNGMENIVVVGNQGDSNETPNSDANGRYGKNTRHFLEASLKYANKLKNRDKDEQTTIIVYQGDYTKEELDSYTERAKKAEINFLVVNDDADIADYVNKKATFALSSSKRNDDKITDFAYFGHGDPNNMIIGYHTFWEGTEKLQASSFNMEAFDSKANIYLASCRSGLGNLYTSFKPYTSGVITGFNVRVQWGEMVENNNITTGLGQYMAWPKDPDNPNKVVPKNQRIRSENGTR